MTPYFSFTHRTRLDEAPDIYLAPVQVLVPDGRGLKDANFHPDSTCLKCGQSAHYDYRLHKYVHYGKQSHHRPILAASELTGETK